MAKYIYLVPLFPLIGFLLNGLLGKKLGKSFVTSVGVGVLVSAFVVSLLSFLALDSENVATKVYLFDFIKTSGLSIPFEFLFDPLSATMLLIITGVGSLIHLYSAGYMHDDEGFFKFFAYLNLFVFFMLLLVLGSNYVIMFIGWEGVGLCSYLLIGFWNKNTNYNNAAKKAFIMNRIGDLGYLLGLFLIFLTFDSLTFEDVFSKATLISEPNFAITAICILLFIGATGKSAQIPLFTWLPDAMAGPTPVSALIHAATMVTAGIYMIVRSNILFTLAPEAQTIIAFVGIATALLAATIGLAQNDIKKVLAYSTVSQLGYMFLALGVGAYSAALFHVMTHAFFKALLFLGAGSVIHAMSGEQDIRKMGSLAKKLPITHLTFILGTIAIAGIPPFAGFFSKDMILAKAFEHSPLLWGLGVIGAMFTAFYMFRLYFLVFHGKFRGTHEQEHHLHESPISMTIPLMVLALLSVVGGFFNIPEIFGGNEAFSKFLNPVLSFSSSKLSSEHHLSHSTEYIMMAVSVGVALISIILAFVTYVKRNIVPEADGMEKGLHKLVYHKYYLDEIYDTLFTKPLFALSSFAHGMIDNKVVDGLVSGISWGVDGLGGLTRRIQAGSVGSYLLLMVIGAIALALISGLVF
ncbi:MAG: NADH-quinone oxidoreductase subunit L [Cytophagales bacterium]